MNIWRGSRASSGIKARGDIAEVWQGQAQVGVVFRWTLSGFDGMWSGYAAKYRFDAGFTGGEVEVRFQLASAPMELIGTARFVGEILIDGDTHSGVVDMEGSKLWLNTGIPVSNGSNSAGATGLKSELQPNSATRQT